jgi:molecular chaperone Hsp33
MKILRVEIPFHEDGMIVVYGDEKMSEIIKGISRDKKFRFVIVDASDVIKGAQKIHGLTDQTIKPLARLMTASLLLSGFLKAESDSIMIQMNASGPMGEMVTKANYFHHVKGYVMQKSDIIDHTWGIEQLIGKEGVMNIIKESGLTAPYFGLTNVVQGDVVTEMTNYLKMSEQIPHIIEICESIDENHSVLLTGGYVIEALPGSHDTMLEQRVLKESLGEKKSFQNMLRDRYSLQAMLDCIFENGVDVHQRN